MPDNGDLGAWIVGAVLIAFALLLVSRWLHRDSSVKSTKFGFYVERRKYGEIEVDDSEIWHVDPLPPPTPPPPLPPPKPDDAAESETQINWPKREGENV